MILITYDVKSNHSEVLRWMLDNGYSKTVRRSNGTDYALPNTTVQSSSNTKQVNQAISDLKAAASSSGTQIISAVAVVIPVEQSQWSFF